MSQQKQASSIYHDLQKNIYYRINKHTGEVKQAYPNGQLLKHFKVDITGNDYKIRKAAQLHSKKSHAIINRDQLKEKIGIHKLKQSVPLSSQKIFSNYRPENSKEESNSLRMVFSKNDISPHKEASFRVKTHESQSHFLTNLLPPHEKSLEKSQSHMGELLKNFCQISSSKVYQNHSSFDKEPGTIIAKRLINSRGFRQTKNSLYHPLQSLSKHKTDKIFKTIPQNQQLNSSISHQLSKQKKMFLQFHPNFGERQNTRLLNEQIERKKNIKKLESLFLQQTAKVTNQIYS